MGSRNFDIATLQARFDALTDLEQAAAWVGFVDALDAGDAGFHPYYLVLAPMYDRGESPFDAERLEMLEPREYAEDDFDEDGLEGLFTPKEMDRLLGSPPF